MRIGTEVPGGPIAGRFVSKGSSAFWALRGSRAVVLELTDSAYDRIVVETDDPAEVVDALGLTGAAPPLDRTEARGPVSAPLPVAVGIAGAVLGAPLVIAASLASSMPSPVAIHWGLDGTPNGSMSLLPAALLLTAIAAIGVVPAAIDVARHGPNAHAIGVAVFMWGIGCAALAATLASNRGVDDWRDAHLSAWWIVVIIGVPLALAVAVHAVVRRE
jgi:hypothetical protein